MTGTFASRLKPFAGSAIILLAAAVAVAPLLFRGPACGSDFHFHFASWLDARRSFLLGIPYPHWAAAPNLGAGEPRFVFYPPLTWMAGAALGLILPWKMVPVVLTFLLLAATGFANRKLAREALDDEAATLAGCAAIFFGYALFTVYKRAAYAELAGGFWIPLLLLYLLRDRNPEKGLWARAFDGSTVPLALVIAGAWLSNSPVGVMASYLLAAMAVAIAVVGKSWAPVLRAAVAGALGLTLPAVYLVPAAWEQLWANVWFAVSVPHYRIENSWLFARHADAKLYAHDVVLTATSWIAVIMLAVAVVGLMIAWLRGTLPGERRWWLPLALIPPVVLFLLLPVSLPVWNLLPKLRFLQFPWRWLLVLEAPMAVFFASAVWPRSRRARIAVIAACGILFVAISAYAGSHWYVDCANTEKSILTAMEDGNGVVGKREYAPPGVPYPLVDVPGPSVCLTRDPQSPEGQDGPGPVPAWSPLARCTGSFVAAMHLPEHKRLLGVADRAGYLIARLRSYPAWHVTVNGQPVTPAVERQYGLMAIPVPQGHVDISVDWTTTTDVVVGRWLSGIALLCLIFLWFLEESPESSENVATPSSPESLSPPQLS
jgi:hypothetical protein